MNKEEPKQEDELCHYSGLSSPLVYAEEYKQKTPEEAGVAYAKTVNENHTSHMLGFYNGAKWHEEQMYNETDKIMKFLDTEIKLGLSDIKTIERVKWYFETYFKQFKKK